MSIGGLPLKIMKHHVQIGNQIICYAAFKEIKTLFKELHLGWALDCIQKSKVWECTNWNYRRASVVCGDINIQYFCLHFCELNAMALRTTS